MVLIGLLGGDAMAQAPTAFQQAWRSGTPVTITGVLTALYADDFANRRSELIHLIQDDRTGQSFQLRFEKAPKGLRSGARVSVVGRSHGSEIYVEACCESTTTSSTLSGVTVLTSPANELIGEQRTLVMVANFSDASVSCSNEFINNAMFADPTGLSVSALYLDNSRGQVSLSGDVVGPYTLDASSNDACNLSGWADAADAAAAAHGVDPGAYARKLYVMPLNTCPGAGFGTVGGSPSAAWVFACHLSGMYAHEVGHNLGMDHAATPTSEYGDTTDPMSFGSDSLLGVNAPHRHELGWLGASATQVVNSDGSYGVSPLSMDPSVATAPQAIIIARPDTQEKYYLSYRVPQGFDNYIDSSYYSRLSIHRYKGDGSSSKTFLLAGLADGQTFVDQINGITVTQVNHDATHVTARIQFTNACLAGTPSVSLSPQAQSGVPGSSLTYTLSLTNQDSPTCAPSTFALNAAVPAGWAGTVAPAGLTLDAGTTAQATLTVVSAVGAAAGTYQMVVDISDNTAAHAASVAGAYTVTAPCAPNAPSFIPSPSSQGGPAGTTLTYGVAVTNRDSAGCPASTFSIQALLPEGWSGALSPSSVSLAPGQVTTVIVSVTSASGAAPASYDVNARTSDANQAMHSASTDITYTVQSQADLLPPTAPAGLTVSASQKLKRIQLSWFAATDNVGVAGYVVLRDGIVVGAATSTGWVDLAYVAGATYTYSVSAYDAAGNVSPPSNCATITLAGGGGGKKR